MTCPFACHAKTLERQPARHRTPAQGLPRPLCRGESLAGYRVLTLSSSLHSGLPGNSGGKRPERPPAGRSGSSKPLGRGRSEQGTCGKGRDNRVGARVGPPQAATGPSGLQAVSCTPSRPPLLLGPQLLWDGDSFPTRQGLGPVKEQSPLPCRGGWAWGEALACTASWWLSCPPGGPPSQAAPLAGRRTPERCREPQLHSFQRRRERECTQPTHFSALPTPRQELACQSS